MLIENEIVFFLMKFLSLKYNNQKIVFLIHKNNH
jgi:uncharacterized sporulation protein YeaH/YhbH (DUF444 family)